MSIDWGEMEKEMSFREYAPAGTYKVKIETVNHHEVGQNGSIAQDFRIEDRDDYAFPKITHWLSFKNDKWRQWHNKSLMVLLGLNEETARKAVEACESKGEKEAITKAYQATYTKLLAKRPEVEVEVWQDGKYGRADFTSKSVRMSFPEDAAPAQADSNDILDTATSEGAEEIDLSEIPF